MSISMSRPALTGIVTACVLCLLVEGAHTVPPKTSQPSWPRWRGLNRDGKSPETNLLPAWPEGGPKLLWSVKGIGRGWSSPIIAGGLLYITGDIGEDLWIFAYRPGPVEKLQWKVRNGRSWKQSHPGARSSCTYDGGKLYHMNARGRVVCLDAASGKTIWTVDTFQRFGAKEIRWGHSECLLIDGERLIVTPGGSKAMMAALDKKTGKTIWASGPLGKDAAIYASPVLFEYGGMRHLVNFSAHQAFGVNADTGKILWSRPRPTRYQVIATVAVHHDGKVFVTSPDGKPAEQYRLTVSGSKVSVEQTWTSEILNCLSGGVIYSGGRLYGSGYRKGDGWHCIDFATGKTLYTKRDLNTGSVILADGLLYCFSERGEMALLKPTDKGFETKGRFRRVEAKTKDSWAHPVICDGRLYLRYHDTLWCYDIRGRKPDNGQ